MTRILTAEEKSLRKFSDKHPIINLILFEISATALCLGISYGINKLLEINIGASLFFLMSALIPLALDQFNDKSSMQISMENLTTQHEVRLNQHKPSPYTLLKYGILGAILFVLSGYYGMI